MLEAWTATSRRLARSTVLGFTSTTGSLTTVSPHAPALEPLPTIARAEAHTWTSGSGLLSIAGKVCYGRRFA